MKPIIGINCDYEEEDKQPYSFCIEIIVKQLLQRVVFHCYCLSLKTKPM